MSNMSNPAAPGAPEASATKPTSSGRSLSMKLKIAGFILGVVAAEWVVAYFYLPSAAPAAATPAAPPAGHEGDQAAEPADAGKSHEASNHGSAHGGGSKSAGRGVQQEVDLGEFTVTAYQPVSSSTLFISFHLYGSASEAPRLPI
jgi:hypothetical protein